MIAHPVNTMAPLRVRECNNTGHPLTPPKKSLSGRALCPQTPMQTPPPSCTLDYGPAGHTRPGQRGDKQMLEQQVQINREILGLIHAKHKRNHTWGQCNTLEWRYACLLAEDIKTGEAYLAAVRSVKEANGPQESRGDTIDKRRAPSNPVRSRPEGRPGPGHRSP